MQLARPAGRVRAHNARTLRPPRLTTLVIIRVGRSGAKYLPRTHILFALVGRYVEPIQHSPTSPPRSCTRQSCVNCCPFRFGQDRQEEGGRLSGGRPREAEARRRRKGRQEHEEAERRLFEVVVVVVIIEEEGIECEEGELGIRRVSQSLLFVRRLLRLFSCSAFVWFAVDRSNRSISVQAVIHLLNTHTTFYLRG